METEKGQTRWRMDDFGRGRKTSEGLSYSEMVKWVLDRVDMEEDQLDPRDAPSPGAWSMLQWVRGEASARKEFFKTILPRAVKDGEEGGGAEDAAAERVRLGKLERIVERLKRVFAAAGIQEAPESPFEQS